MSARARKHRDANTTHLAKLYFGFTNFCREVTLHLFPLKNSPPVKATARAAVLWTKGFAQVERL